MNKNKPTSLQVCVSLVPVSFFFWPIYSNLDVFIFTALPIEVY